MWGAALVGRPEWVGMGQVGWGGSCTPIPTQELTLAWGVSLWGAALVGCPGWGEVRHPWEGSMLHPHPHGGPNPHAGHLRVEHWGDALCRVGAAARPPPGMGGRGAVPSGHPVGWGQDGQRGTGVRGRPTARQPVGLGAGAKPAAPVGAGLWTRVPGSPRSGRGRGTPVCPVSFPQLRQGGFSPRAGSLPGRRSRSTSPLCPGVLAAGGFFPSLPFPDGG